MKNLIIPSLIAFFVLGFFNANLLALAPFAFALYIIYDYRINKKEFGKNLSQNIGFVLIAGSIFQFVTFDFVYGILTAITFLVFTNHNIVKAPLKKVFNKNEKTNTNKN